MPGLWKNARLLNDPANVMVDVIITTTIPLTYLPQLHFLTSKFSTGISPYYLLSTCMLSTTLLTEALCFAVFLYPSPTNPILARIRAGEIKGARAFGALAGVLQIAMVWFCACVSLGTYVSKEGLSIAVVAFLHAAVTLGVAMGVALPKPTPRDMGTEIVCAVVGMVGAVCGPLSLVLGFAMQVWELKRGGMGALSEGGLGMQALMFGAVAWRWFLRLGEFEGGDWGEWRKLGLRRKVEASWERMGVWYRWGFLGWNLGLWAVGCAVLFGVCVGIV